jgi:hypothetical protein
MKAHTLTIARCHLYLTRVGAVLAAVCALSVFLYGTFLLLTVEHAAAQTAAQSQIDALAGHVGDLEAQYLAAARALTPDTAAALGYVSPVAVTSVYTDADSGALSLRTGN